MAMVCDIPLSTDHNIMFCGCSLKKSLSGKSWSSRKKNQENPNFVH